MHNSFNSRAISSFLGPSLEFLNSADWSEIEKKGTDFTASSQSITGEFGKLLGEINIVQGKIERDLVAHLSSYHPKFYEFLVKSISFVQELRDNRRALYDYCAVEDVDELPADLDFAGFYANAKVVIITSCRLFCRERVVMHAGLCACVGTLLLVRLGIIDPSAEIEDGITKFFELFSEFKGFDQFFGHQHKTIEAQMPGLDKCLAEFLSILDGLEPNAAIILRAECRFGVCRLVLGSESVYALRFVASGAKGVDDNFANSLRVQDALCSAMVNEVIASSKKLLAKGHDGIGVGLDDFFGHCFSAFVPYLHFIGKLTSCAQDLLSEANFVSMSHVSRVSAQSGLRVYGCMIEVSVCGFLEIRDELGNFRIDGDFCAPQEIIDVIEDTMSDGIGSDVCVNGVQLSPFEGSVLSRSDWCLLDRGSISHGSAEASLGSGVIEANNLTDVFNRTLMGVWNIIKTCDLRGSDIYTYDSDREVVTIGLRSYNHDVTAMSKMSSINFSEEEFLRWRDSLNTSLSSIAVCVSNGSCLSGDIKFRDLVLNGNLESRFYSSGAQSDFFSERNIEMLMRRLITPDDWVLARIGGSAFELGHIFEKVRMLFAEYRVVVATFQECLSGYRARFDDVILNLRDSIEIVQRVKESLSCLRDYVLLYSVCAHPRHKPPRRVIELSQLVCQCGSAAICLSIFLRRLEKIRDYWITGGSMELSRFDEFSATCAEKLTRLEKKLLELSSRLDGLDAGIGFCMGDAAQASGELMKAGDEFRIKRAECGKVISLGYSARHYLASTNNIYSVIKQFVDGKCDAPPGRSALLSNEVWCISNATASIVASIKASSSRALVRVGSVTGAYSTKFVYESRTGVESDLLVPQAIKKLVVYLSTCVEHVGEFGKSSGLCVGYSGTGATCQNSVPLAQCLSDVEDSCRETLTAYRQFKCERGLSLTTEHLLRRPEFDVERRGELLSWLICTSDKCLEACRDYLEKYLMERYSNVCKLNICAGPNELSIGQMFCHSGDGYESGSRLDAKKLARMFIDMQEKIFLRLFVDHGSESSVKAIAFLKDRNVSTKNPSMHDNDFAFQKACLPDFIKKWLVARSMDKYLGVHKSVLDALSRVTEHLDFRTLYDIETINNCNSYGNFWVNFAKSDAIAEVMIGSSDVKARVEELHNYLMFLRLFANCGVDMRDEDAFRDHVLRVDRLRASEVSRSRSTASAANGACAKCMSVFDCAVEQYRNPVLEVLSSGVVKFTAKIRAIKRICESKAREFNALVNVVDEKSVLFFDVFMNSAAFFAEDALCRWVIAAVEEIVKVYFDDDIEKMLLSMHAKISEITHLVWCLKRDAHEWGYDISDENTHDVLGTESFGVDDYKVKMMNLLVDCLKVLQQTQANLVVADCWLLLVLNPIKHRQRLCVDGSPVVYDVFLANRRLLYAAALMDPNWHGGLEWVAERVSASSLLQLKLRRGIDDTMVRILVHANNEIASVRTFRVALDDCIDLLRCANKKSVSGRRDVLLRGILERMKSCPDFYGDFMGIVPFHWENGDLEAAGDTGDIAMVVEYVQSIAGIIRNIQKFRQDIAARLEQVLFSGAREDVSFLLDLLGSCANESQELFTRSADFDIPVLPSRERVIRDYRVDHGVEVVASEKIESPTEVSIEPDLGRVDISPRSESASVCGMLGAIGVDKMEESMQVHQFSNMKVSERLAAKKVIGPPMKVAASLTFEENHEFLGQSKHDKCFAVTGTRVTQVFLSEGTMMNR